MIIPSHLIFIFGSNKELSNICEKIVRGKADAAFRFGPNAFHNLKANSYSMELNIPVLTVWSSIAEGFPIASSRIHLYNKGLSNSSLQV